MQARAPQISSVLKSRNKSNFRSLNKSLDGFIAFPFSSFYFFLITFFISLSFASLQAETTDSLAEQTMSKLTFFEPANKLNKGRLIGISTFGAVSYTSTMLLMNSLWYSQYDRGKFHFFNDNGGWLQIDKIGHSWTAYMESQIATDLYRWAGVDHKKAVWIGGGLAWMFQGGIELLDGFSKEWGASWGDLLSNTAGSALWVSQELMWEEQRIYLKYGSYEVSTQNTSDPVLKARALELYGSNLGEQLLKDYNRQSYWLSINPSSFMKRNNKFPKWINVAVGYGAGGLYGADENVWETEDGEIIDYSNVDRYRQFFLSLDIDLRRINTRFKWLNVIFDSLNSLKIPFPALEFNTKGQIKGHWFL